MNIFLATSCSSKVNYNTGEVFPEYKVFVEDVITLLESLGHDVFCALRVDCYKINDADPAAAFHLDMREIAKSDTMLALLGGKVSTGAQTEIGIGVALQKRVILAHAPEDQLAYFNNAMLKAGVVQELSLPLLKDDLVLALQSRR